MNKKQNYEIRKNLISSGVSFAVFVVTLLIYRFILNITFTSPYELFYTFSIMTTLALVSYVIAYKFKDYALVIICPIVILVAMVLSRLLVGGAGAWNIQNITENFLSYESFVYGVAFGIRTLEKWWKKR